MASMFRETPQPALLALIAYDTVIVADRVAPVNALYHRIPPPSVLQYAPAIR